MSETQSSKSQRRVIGLLEWEHDGTYDMASRLLSAAGLPRDGVPDGFDWRSAGKLSDTDLLAAFGQIGETGEVKTSLALRQERATDAKARNREYNARLLAFQRGEISSVDESDADHAAVAAANLPSYRTLEAKEG